MRGFKKNSWMWGEKGRNPEALILFALILLNLISNVPGTSRQILRKQIDRKFLKKERKDKTTIQKANFLYHIYPVQCQTLNTSRPVRCATITGINIDLSATFS